MQAIDSKSAFLPRDRAESLENGTALPEHVSGTLMLADISGFTALTEQLRQKFGDRLGAEELTRQLNVYYAALIAEVQRFGGSVIGFSGDGITCWFDGNDLGGFDGSAGAAVSAAKWIRINTRHNNSEAQIAVKIVLATGDARRFVVGDPATQRIDILTGKTSIRTVLAEQIAERHEIVADRATVDHLEGQIDIIEWRSEDTTSEEFAIIDTETIVTVQPLFENATNRALPDDIARQWVLPAVNQQIDAGLRAVQSELRPAVALFLRFTGIDFESDSLAGVKLDRFTRWAQSIVTRYGGNIIQLTVGDKGSYVYVAFGAPVAHEDDPYRAVAAALELNQPPADMELQTRIGISQGIMRTGTYGSPSRYTYGVLGDEVNLAARLMTRTAAGTVLVSGRVRKSVERQFAFTDMPPITVKGKRESIPVAQLSRKHSTIEMIAVNPRPMLMGRQLELSQLLVWTQPILERSYAGIIEIVGEAGIGKTHLINALHDELTDRYNIQWLTASADELLQNSLRPFASFVRSFFDVRRNQDRDRQINAFNHRYDQFLDDLAAAPLVDTGLRSELSRTRSFLAALVGLRLGDSLYENLSPALRLTNTLTALRNLFLAESQRQPLVLQIEDSHWLDDDSWQLVTDLNRQAIGYPLVIILTSRDASADDRVRHRLELGEMPLVDLRAVAEATLGDTIAESVVTILRNKSNGNPFFAEQLVLDLQARAMLEQRAGVWQFVSDRTIEVPDTLNAVLIARIDRLPAATQAVIQAGAVLGQAFESAVLAAMLDGVPTTTAIHTAEDDGIWSRVVEGQYHFRHVLLRDAAYAMQLTSRLRELHRRAAEVIETLYPNDDDQLLVLVEHWHRAGDKTQEIHYADRAVKYLLSASQYRDAAAIARRAVAIAEETAAVLSLLLNLGQALYRLGDYEEAQTYLVESLHHARRYNDTQIVTKALLNLGRVAAAQGDFTTAAEYYQQSYDSAASVADRDGLAISLTNLGIIAARRGDFGSGRDFYLRSLELFRELEHASSIAMSLMNLGNVIYNQGDSQTALDYLADSLKLYREIDDKQGMSWNLASQGWIADQEGDLLNAQMAYQQSLTITREIGDRWGLANGLVNLSFVFLKQHNTAAALENLRAALQLALDMRAISIMLEAVAGIAVYLYEIQELQSSAELVALVEGHPAKTVGIEGRIAWLRDALSAELSSSDYQTALEAGTDRDLVVIADEILASLMVEQSNDSMKHKI